MNGPQRDIHAQQNPVYLSPQGIEKSNEHAGVTNKPNANIMHSNGRPISRGFENVTNMPMKE